MSLQPGTRLGTYELTGVLGAGGMGEVYRARDTKLNRDVAIKVLPTLFVLDPDRLARFEREAQTLAALNHPNIAQIFAVLESPAALVMELVEGDDLSVLMARGPIPLTEALPIAGQIANALEAAHEQGIVHRDLKPANIKVRPDGTVKVLDFGLAKAMDTGRDGAPGAIDMAHSPTFTSPAQMTQMGVILGTAAYMAPEQARGKVVDKRADIWAFGVILYEMLTGRRLFAGDTITDVLAAVVMCEPDWTALPAQTPSSIKRLLARCLEKDAKRRLRDSGDVRMEIEEAIARRPDAVPGGEPVVPAAQRILDTRRGRLIGWTISALAGAMFIAGIVASGAWPRRGAPEIRPLRVSILHSEGNEVGSPVISPDGRRVAYRARRADGMPLLWVRDLATGEAQSLPGTEDASTLFWSADSRDLGFFAGAAMKRVPAGGGPVRVIVDYIGTFGGYGATWARDGTILFNGSFTGLSRVSADGGPMTLVTKAQSEDWAHFWPSFLPDGRHFVFTAKLWTRAAEASEQGIYLGSLDSPKIEKLLPELSSAVYAPPGYLVFSREGALMAVSFDADAGRITGTPAPIGGNVATDGSMYFAAVSASADGTLAVRPPPAVALISAANNTPNSELHLVDRSGAGSLVSAARLFSYFMAISPVDNHVLALATLDARTGTQDLSIMDLSKDSMVPLKTTQGFTGNPVWSIDGRRLAYSYQPPGQLDDVYVKEMATGAIQPVIQTPTVLEHPQAWSHDQKSLLIFTSDDKGSYLASWSFPSHTLTRLVGARAMEGAAFSLHDDFIAFTSQESGRPEVYVTTFPDHRQTWPLTTDGGRVVSWSSDGREILVATVSGHLVAYSVSVSTDGGFSHGQPAMLVRDVGIMAIYSAATADHSHILIRVSPDASKDKGEIRLLFGWQNAMR